MNEIEVHYFTPQSLLRGQVPLPKPISNLGRGGGALLIAASEQKKENLAEMCELRRVKL